MTQTTILIDRGRRALAARESTNSESNWELGEVAAEWLALGGERTATSLATELRCDRTWISVAAQVWLLFARERSRWICLSWTHFAVTRNEPDACNLLDAAVAESLSVLDLRRRLRDCQSAPTAESLTLRLRATIGYCRRHWPAENFSTLAELLASVELQIRREIEAAIVPPPPC